jgi:inositol transport system substrate-binding protein
MTSARKAAPALAAAALLLAACGSTGNTTATTSSAAAPGGGSASPSAARGLDLDIKGSLSGKTICFGFQALETEFWAAGVKAISTALQKAGAKVVEYNSNEDANRQLEQVNDCITQKVDGILIIPQDGESAVTITGAANKAGIPIGIFNRPPASNKNPALVSVADNRSVSKQTNEYLAEQAKKLGRKVQAVIMVGDLGDPNAVERKNGFYDVVNANPDLFAKPIEVETKWDAATAQQNLQSALQANPKIDLLFTSSDFMYPQIQSVLSPLGRWKKVGEPGHVILGGLDGDNRACGLMRSGYVDATGVQDLFTESENVVNGLISAIDSGQKTVGKVVVDPGFALTQANLQTKADQMWGCVIAPPK